MPLSRLQGGIVKYPISEELAAKLEAFRAALEAATARRLSSDGYSLEVHAGNWECTVKVGRKYANVDRGRSGCYMVDVATQEIFSIKGYGVIHRGHRFGTLDTINEWDWSDYRAVKLAPRAA